MHAFRDVNSFYWSEESKENLYLNETVYILQLPKIPDHNLFGIAMHITMAM